MCPFANVWKKYNVRLSQCTSLKNHYWVTSWVIGSLLDRVMLSMGQQSPIYVRTRKDCSQWFTATLMKVGDRCPIESSALSNKLPTTHLVTQEWFFRYEINVHFFQLCVFENDICLCICSPSRWCSLPPLWITLSTVVLSATFMWGIISFLQYLCLWPVTMEWVS